MIGVKVNPVASRHAIIYVGAQNGTLVFLNNRRKDSPEPDSFRWTEAEFMNLMDREIIPIAKVVPCEKKKLVLEEYMDMKLLDQALDRWKDCILREQHKAMELGEKRK